MGERITNAVLLEKILGLKEMVISVKEDTIEIKNNDKEKWKQINKNAQNIAGIKGASGIIAGIVSMLTAGIIAYFFKKV